MAKPTYAKLSLKTNLNTNELIYGEQSIEVKEYLPIEEKMEMITSILNSCGDDNYRFYNPGYLEMQTVLNIVFYYTNLSFTPKQKENFPKLYDSLVSSGFYKKVIELIPEEEIDFINYVIKKAIKSIYAYNNSVMGFMETLKKDYSDMDFNATEIQKKLGDRENVEFLQKILDKLG
jgi:hypothetical protein